MSMHQYTIEVESNEDPEYHPITVTVLRHRNEIASISGKKLRPILKQLAEFITDEEAKEN